MRQKCDCNQYELEFNVFSLDVKCPKCGKEYLTIVESNDNGRINCELILKKETIYS